jgi:hypothetical protein
MPLAWKPRLQSISAKGEGREEYMCDCDSRGELMTGQDAGEGDKIGGVGGVYGGCAREYMGLGVMAVVYLIAPVATCTSG